MCHNNINPPLYMDELLKQLQMINEQIWEYFDICPCVLNLTGNEVVYHMHRLCTSVLREQVNKQT